ncbi:MAG: DUF1573 domain-containing protein, partial [Myxococcota bacterium]
MTPTHHTTAHNTMAHRHRTWQLGLLLLGAVALGGGLATAAWSQPLPQRPIAQWSSQHHNVGSVSFGAQPSAVFKVTNIGGAPLEVMFVQPSSVRLVVLGRPRRPIWPGETQLLTVRYMPRQRGPFQVHLVVTTNEPSRQGNTTQTKLTLEGVQT